MSNPRHSDPRDGSMSSTTLKDVRDTDMLKGEAKSTPAESAKNKMVPDVNPGGIPKGKNGGENQY